MKFLLCILFFLTSVAQATESFVAFFDSTEYEKAKTNINHLEAFDAFLLLVIEDSQLPMLPQNVISASIPKVTADTKKETTSHGNNFQAKVPDLAMSHEEWGSGEIKSWGLQQLGVARAHSFTRGSGAKVMIVGTGLSLNHPEFVHLNITSQDFTGNELSIFHPYPVHDIVGHETHISGIAVGSRFGVAPEAALYVARAGDFQLNNRAVVAALNWAVEEKVDVVNLSSSSLGFPTDIARIVYDKLYEENIIVVTSSGNLKPGLKNNGIGIPGIFATSLTVGATDDQLHPADFSVPGDQVDLCAPGVDIPSASLTKGINATKDLVSIKSGTSMAAPYVTGAVALLRSLKPNIDFWEIKNLLESTADRPENSATYIRQCGAGTIHIGRAVEKLARQIRE